MDVRTLLRSARCLPVLPALVALGCATPLEPVDRSIASDPQGQLAIVAAPGGARSGYYPLAIGNRWGYLREETLSLVYPGEPPGPPVEYVTSWIHEIVCVQTLDGVDYPVARVTGITPNGTVTYWRLYRQDASGLYEFNYFEGPPTCLPAGEARAADPSALESRTIWDLVAPRTHAGRTVIQRLRAQAATLPAVSRPAADPSFGLPVPGARPGEQQRLRYPLRIKSRWKIDAFVPMAAEVVGHEALHLPAGQFEGYRIRLDTPWYGRRPDPTVYGFPIASAAPDGESGVWVWYGPQGYLQLEAHLELEFRDIDGAISVGRYDQRERLTDLQLVTPVAGFPPPLAGLPR